ncbi:MAG: hypothetical protein NXI24_07610 [bacterium]|nr:hypothetical protein [bacterium]
MSDSAATESLVNEPQFLSKDSAERLFRVQDTEGQSPDFVENRDLLAEIYETIHNLTTVAYEKGTLEFPDTGEVYRAFTGARRERGNRKALPDSEEFRGLLAILAGQSSPLIHFIREINFDKGEFKIKTRYATPSSSKENAIRRAYQTSLIKSGLMIRGAMQEGATTTAWGEVQSAIKTAGGLAELSVPYKAERADLLLRNLFLRPPAGADALQQGHYQKINQEQRLWLYVPLIKDLQKSGVLRVVLNNDLRESDTKNFARLPDFIYFYEADKIKARYMNLCLFLTTDSLGKYGELSLFSEAHAARSEPEALFEAGGKLVESILKNIKGGGKQPSAAEAEVFAEALKLAEIVRKQLEKKAQDDEQKALSTIADGVRKQENLVEIYRRGQRLRFEEKFLRRFLADQIPNMLIGTVPPRQTLGYGKNTPLEEFERVFALAKNTAATTAAIDMALDIFNKSGDDFFLNLIEEILDLDRTSETKLQQYTSPVSILKLKEALKAGYTRELPFWRRLWLMLTGGEVDPRDILEAKTRRLAEAEKRIQRHRDASAAGKRSDAQRAIKERARENMGDKKGSERETMQKMLQYIDSSWQKNSFPGRSALRAEKSLGSRFYIDKILDGVDGGGAGYSDILRIPVQNEDGGIYITKSFLQQKGPSVKKSYDQKIDELIPILTGTKIDEVRKGAARRNHMLYSAIVKFMENRK